MDNPRLPTPPGLPPCLPIDSLPRLLVVDDQPVNIQVLYEIFRADHEVFMASSGQQALEACFRDPPDLILLDVVMPGMDGHEVCRQLKADPATREIPVIFVTAQESPAEETQGLSLGAVDFISKPVNPAVVRARVKAQLTLKRQSDLLRSLAFIDGLTGIANRRRFDESLEKEGRQSLRNQTPLSLIMIDIDHFKQFNDAYGHQEGDYCLRHIANSLNRCVGRPHDLVARYGGEEFVCLLPDTDLTGALTKADDLAQAIKDLAIPHQHSSAGSIVTISQGVAVATINDDFSTDTLLAAADELLYEAKGQGRNRVCASELQQP
jgi:diguanylate cyclase (GGDEF)-like protein